MSMRHVTGRESVSDHPAGRELDLAGLGRVLRQKRRWVLGPALACCLAAVAFVSLVQSRYTADAKVIIENGESYFTRPDKSELQQPPPLPDDEAVQSEVQLITSRDIAREAIRRLDLKGNPEFDPVARGIGPLSRVLILLGLERDPTLVAPEERILQSYYERLQVFPLVKSRVIAVEFTASDPDLAARAANTIADLYIEAQSDAKRDRARSAADSLATLVADLRVRSIAAANKADEFRSRAGLLVGSNNTTISTQQLADINTQLAQARTAEADAQAKAKLIREMIRQGRVAEIPDVANNELIRRVSEQRVSLRAEVALQSRTLLPGHPHMQELNAQLQDVDAQLRAAAEKAVRTLENDAHIAAGRVANLTAALDAQKRTVSDAGADQVELNTLDAQARLLKDQLEFNTSKYQEALARESAASTPADARVISRANPPQVPSFPKKLPTIAIATLAALILSAALIVARELLSGRAFAAPLEGEMPAPKALGLKPGFSPEDADPEAARLETEPASSGLTAEGLMAQLREIRGADGMAVRVLISAPVPSHETAQATMVLARRLAVDVRTVLVDFDSAVPAVVRIAGLPPDESLAPLGLSDLLSQKAGFADIIHRDAASRLHVVPVGRENLGDWNAGDCLLVLEALAETYACVLLHMPPAKATTTAEAMPDIGAAVVVSAAADPDAEVATLVDALGSETSRPAFAIRTDALLPQIQARSAA